MPDMAETLALRFLNNLCESVKDYYHPGARIILCSDGRVFSDIIGMKEAHVSEYQRGIDHLIEEHKLSNLSTFSLDDLHGSRDFEFSRQALMETFGSSSEVLRERINRAAIGSTNAEDIEAQRMYCGITRFLVEDSFDPDQKLSKTALQKQCKKRALEVICRSNAWSELIAHTFDHAIRLSIHPQHCGSKKLGIQLLGEETWMTPWHGVAVNTKQGFTLMKRWEAQALNAELIIDDNGRPSHYQMQSLN
jgi:pyoverdine/dityrosine biosynthesis protein Dit1